MSRENLNTMESSISENTVMDVDKLTKLIIWARANDIEEIQSWLDNTTISLDAKREVLKSQSESYITPGGRGSATPFQWCCICFAKTNNNEVMENIMIAMIRMGGEEMLKIKDSGFGGNGLQYALANKVTMNIIQELVSASVDLIEATNNEGDNALHIATRFDVDFNVINGLLESDRFTRKLLKDTNTSNILPIHYACKYHSDIRVIKLFLNKDTVSLANPVQNSTEKKLELLCYAFDGGSTVRHDIIEYLIDQLDDDESDFFDVISQHKLMKSMFFWTRQQPPQIKANALKRRFIRKFLNASFIHPIYLSFLFLDLYAHLALVILFSIGIDQAVIEGDAVMDKSIYRFIILALSWKGLREFLQILTISMEAYILGQ